MFIRSRISATIFFAERGFYPQVDERQFDILEDIQFVDEVEALENESDLSFAVEGPVLLF